MITHPASVLKTLYPSLQWNVTTDKKQLFLSFDDGPTVGVTDQLLDLLSSYNAKASFFCIGKNIIANQALFKRIVDEGHTVGNHTYNHLNGWKSNNIDYLRDVEKFQEVYSSRYFRPPYGRMKPAQIAALKSQYQIMMWSALSMDYHPNTSAKKSYEKASAKLKSGDILLFHDSKKAADKMMYAVERILKEKAKEGYEFLGFNH